MRILSAVSLIIIFLSSCGPQKSTIESFGGYAQGTTYSIVYEDNQGVEPAGLQQKTDRILRDFDMSLSLYKDSSILSRVNRNEDVVADSFFTEAFRRSREIAGMTGGAFDITIGPLARAWGFGPDERRNFTESKRDSLLRLVGMEKVRLENGRVFKDDPAIQLDFNAIAQGYSVDVICAFLRNMGFENFLVEIGGEVRGVGTKAGEKWRIGIDKPFDNNLSPGQDLEAIIRISDEALATSGNYRKFYVENGVKYSHTIDPHTGYPAKNNLLSVTIIAKDCATADGIATACMVMGLEKSLEFISEHKEFLGFFVYSDKEGNLKTWTSEGLKDRISDGS